MKKYPDVGEINEQRKKYSGIVNPVRSVVVDGVAGKRPIRKEKRPEPLLYTIWYTILGLVFYLIIILLVASFIYSSFKG